VRALALLALGVLALAGCGGSDSKPLLASGKAASVRGSLTPDVQLFGEPVVASIDVVVDREQVPPEDVQVKTDFEPYEAVAETAVARADVGRFTHLRYTTELRCLSERCIPRTAEGETTVSQLPGLPPFIPGQQRDEKVKYAFPPALVTAKAEPDKVLGRVVWPPLRSLSRINWYDSKVVGQGFPFVATVTPLPDTTYRVSPTVLGVLLLALAVAIVALPVGYLARRMRARREPKSEDAAALSPLERALALVEWASRRPSIEERREALEALAYELDAETDHNAARARAQGWSPPSPAPEKMSELASAVREGHANQA
jgi:hypothetical protein